MNYYNHHIGDYTTDTAHLSLLEDGAYRRLMDRYYTTEAPLTRDETALFRLVRARTEDEQTAVRIVLSEFFQATDAGWVHKRCDEEIAAYKEKCSKAADAANKRWNKPGNPPDMPPHSEGNADAMLTNNQEPITKNQEPRTKKSKTDPAPPMALPDWVPADAWGAFIAMRKAIRKPVAASAWPLALQKLDQLRAGGSDPRAVLEQSTLNSWQGLFEVRELHAQPAPRASPGPQLDLAAAQRAANDEAKRRLGILPAHDERIIDARE